MPSDINKVILIGRLTKDPDLRHTPNGTSVASFSIANNRTYVTGGEKKELVSYFNCVAWTKLADLVAQYCKKGNRVAVEGRLQQRSWDDQEGKKHTAVEVVVDNVQFLTPRDSQYESHSEPAQSQDSYSPPAYNPPADSGPNALSDDDIPF
jgi:single-strand DNA-binding protein